MKILAFLVPVFLMLGLLTGCEEKDVPFVVDEDEIARYVVEDVVARELFRTDSMITTDIYTMPFDDSATYRDSVIAVTRLQFEVVFPGANGDGKDADGEYILSDYGNLGFLREAYVEIMDKFTVQTLRFYNGDTIQEIISDRRLKRLGFFVKLGDDSQPYLGWLLWGFNGLDGNYMPVNVTFTDSHANSYSVGLVFYPDTSVVRFNSSRIYFKRLSNFTPITEGSNLIVTTQTNDAVTPTRRLQFISAAEDDGFMTRPMTFIGTNSEGQYREIDTVKTPTMNRRTWNLIYMQSFKSDEFFFLGNWVVPYKVD
ncbi:MAG: hypothetical protein ACOYVF_15075 [Candidatus Zixiibacteriota bacterium]